MSYLKTKENDADVMAFLNAIDDEQKKADSIKLLKMFEDVSGYEAKLWGNRIIGFGKYIYKTKAGKEGEWFLTGFAPTKSNLSLHLMFGLEDESHALSKLGKHSIGKGCLYIKTLSDVDIDILKGIVVTMFSKMKNEVQ
ncbi:DUF1801 domain-containing protein [Psychroserpens sp. MEBiC05023]